MALGTWPDAVPEKYRIPAAAFASGEDVGRFHDVAPQMGLNVFASAGGVIVGVVQSVATSAPVFEDIPGTPSTLVLFVVLLAVLLIRPQGLLGKSER